MKIGELVNTMKEAEEMIHDISCRIDNGEDIQVGDLTSLSDVRSVLKDLVSIISNMKIP